MNENLLIFPAISFILLVNQLNPVIKDFFTNNFVVFVTLTLLFFKVSNNIVLSMAEAFITVLAINLVTLQDPLKTAKEAFQLIYPTPDSKLTCNDFTVEKLLSLAGGENKLKEMMLYKGVPGNIQINDANAPLIATYLEVC